jgi:hypothetical protein
VANILAIPAFLIAALVVAEKYFNITIPTVTEVAMSCIVLRSVTWSARS